MRIVFDIFLVLSLSASPSAASDKKASFDGQAAWSYIRDLSTDAMLGGKSGHRGGVLGGEYIASRFKEWGVEAVGTQHLLILNEQCLWKEEGRDQIMDVVALMLKAEYGRGDFANVFSSTFLRILDQVR